MNCNLVMFARLKPRIRLRGKRWAVLHGKGSNRISRCYDTLPEAARAAEQIFCSRILGYAQRYNYIRLGLQLGQPLEQLLNKRDRDKAFRRQPSCG